MLAGSIETAWVLLKKKKNQEKLLLGYLCRKTAVLVANIDFFSILEIFLKKINIFDLILIYIYIYIFLNCFDVFTSKIKFKK